MPAAFGPVLPATSWITVMLVYAEETPSDFVREVPEGTRYVGEKWAARAAPTSVPADHFASRGAVAQNKHSLATGSSKLACSALASSIAGWLSMLRAGVQAAGWHGRRDRSAGVV